MAKIKRLKIVEKKLGRANTSDTFVLGRYWETDRIIEIDPRQRSKEYLDTCIHELLHHADPNLSESKVSRLSAIITNGLWRQNFRRIMR